MAIPIKAVPILTGKIADDFVRKAEEREKNPAPGLSPEREERIAKVMRQMREIKFPWEYSTPPELMDLWGQVNP